MKEIVEGIFSGNLTAVKEYLNDRLNNLVDEKFDQIKARLANKMVEEDFHINNVQKMGRTKLIRMRVRAGKVQKRVKKSAVPGYTVRGGNVVRMSTQERIKRRISARQGKIKRKAKLTQSLRKRQRSLIKRKVMGL